jgi:hypothetical protein
VGALAFDAHSSIPFLVVEAVVHLKWIANKHHNQNNTSKPRFFHNPNHC